MIQLSENQLDAIVEVKSAPFKQALTDRICEDFSKEPHAISRIQILSKIEKFWNEAPKHEMISEADYVRYHYLMFGLETSWRDNPDYRWIAERLDEGGSGKQKLDYIYDVLSGAADEV